MNNQPIEYTIDLTPAIMKKRKENSRKLFLSSLIIGSAIIAGILLSKVVSSKFNLFSTMFGFNNSIYYDAIRYLITTSLCMFLPFLLVCPILNKKTVETVNLSSSTFGMAIGCILFSCFGILLGNIISTTFVSLVPQINNPVIYASPAPKNLEELFVQLLYVAVLPAMIEEFCFRGIVFGILKPYGKLFSVIASTVLFSAIHGNFVQIPFAFIIGLFLAFITLLSNSLWPAIIVHFINNGYSCILTYLEENGYITGKIITLTFYLVCLVLGIVGAVILSCSVNFGKNKTDSFGPVVTGIVPTIKNKFFAFWLCPTIIIVLIYEIRRAVSLIL